MRKQLKQMFYPQNFPPFLPCPSKKTTKTLKGLKREGTAPHCRNFKGALEEPKKIPPPCEKCVFPLANLSPRPLWARRGGEGLQALLPNHPALQPPPPDDWPRRLSYRAFLGDSLSITLQHSPPSPAPVPTQPSHLPECLPCSSV